MVLFIYFYIVIYVGIIFVFPQAFVHRFSVSMEQEYKSKGINVQVFNSLMACIKTSSVHEGRSDSGSMCFLKADP